MPKPSLPSVLITCLVGLALAGMLLIWMGAGNGGQVLGVQFGYQEPPRAGGDWQKTLAAEAAAQGIVEWTIRDRASMWFEGRRCFFRATIQGTRDSQTVTVDAKLESPDGGEWTITEWRDQ